MQILPILPIGLRDSWLSRDADRPSPQPEPSDRADTRSSAPEAYLSRGCHGADLTVHLRQLRLLRFDQQGGHREHGDLAFHDYRSAVHSSSSGLAI